MLDEIPIHLPSGTELLHGSRTYTIARVLGDGGFGITYLARDSLLDRDVAIKEFFPKHIGSRSVSLAFRLHAEDDRETLDWARDRFVEEARLLARFRNANIVNVLDYFEDNQTAYMVMDYLRGETLERRYKRERLSETQARNLMGDLLRALDAVHGAKVIHRDIKPANIVLEADDRPVLIDFGAARGSIGERTQSIAAMISPPFSPRERYGNTLPQIAATDLYALAATIYRAMLGDGPPEAMARDELGLPELDAAVARGEVSLGFASLLARSMAFRAADRPARASDVAEELASLPPPGCRATAVRHKDPGQGVRSRHRGQDATAPEKTTSGPSIQGFSTRCTMATHCVGGGVGGDHCATGLPRLDRPRRKRAPHGLGA